MALNLSPEFKGSLLKFYVLQFKAAKAVTKLTSGIICLMGIKFHVCEASGFEEKNFNIFLCVSMVETQEALGRI